MSVVSGTAEQPFEFRRCGGSNRSTKATARCIDEPAIVSPGPTSTATGIAGDAERQCLAGIARDAATTSKVIGGTKRYNCERRTRVCGESH